MGQTSDWVSLGEAAQIIGVHPATIRNWAEHGDLPYRRTPGGHRRFRRADLQQWLASHRMAPPLEAQIVVQNALGRTRLEIGDRQKLSHLDWYGKLSPDVRESMRQQGLRLMDALIQHLVSATTDKGQETAREIGTTYGSLLKSQKLSLSQALEGYFYFSNFLFDAVLQIAQTNSPRPPAEWGAMLIQVNVFTREILTSMVAVYERK